MNAAVARKLALSLPEASEQDHHGFPSFRVGKKIFATLPDGGSLNVMLDAEQVPDAIASAPDVCEELWWGQKLAGVRVRLSACLPDQLDPMLRDAWRRIAPKRLLSLLDEPPR